MPYYPKDSYSGFTEYVLYHRETPHDVGDMYYLCVSGWFVRVCGL